MFLTNLEKKQNVLYRSDINYSKQYFDKNTKKDKKTETSQKGVSVFLSLIIEMSEHYKVWHNSLKVIISTPKAFH